MAALRYLFEDYTFDTGRRELHRGTDAVSITPQVFDLLDYLIRNRERVVSKDDLINAIWNGRIVSDAALTTRLNAARSAIGDWARNSASSRRYRAKASVSLDLCSQHKSPAAAAATDNLGESPKPALTLPDKPSIAVLPFRT